MTPGWRSIRHEPMCPSPEGDARRDGVLKDAGARRSGPACAKTALAERVSGTILSSMPVHLYGHLTWTTLRRLPLLNPDVARFLERFVRQEAARHGARVLETGIVSNHVHAIVQLPPVIDIPRLMQGLKGASARIANRDGLMPRARLRWADGYDLRSVGVRQLAGALRYVRQQAEHHPDLAIRPSGPQGAERPLQG